MSIPAGKPEYFIPLHINQHTCSGCSFPGIIAKFISTRAQGFLEKILLGSLFLTGAGGDEGTSGSFVSVVNSGTLHLLRGMILITAQISRPSTGTEVRSEAFAPFYFLPSQYCFNKAKKLAGETRTNWWIYKAKDL